MNKRLNLFFFLCAAALAAHAQWAPKDSLNLQRVLQGEGEVKLNSNVVKQINFGSFVGEPLMSTDKPALKYDAKLPLPEAKIEKKEIKLSLLVYGPHVKFNYDPVYKRKIKVGPDTWKGDSLIHLVTLKRYTNKAYKPFDKEERKSVSDIEATGLRYNPIGERANGMAVGVWQNVPPEKGKISTSMSGSTIGSLDFMKPFTREYWDRAGRKRRERTLELLEHYGDSTTTSIKEELKTKLP